MHLAAYLTNADAYPQFIASQIVNRPDGTVAKVPCNPRGQTSAHNDPSNWRQLSWMEEQVERLGPSYRLGFSFTLNTMKFFLDIDKCIVDGKLNPLGEKLFKRFIGCFIEVSQSGTGLHIIGSYTGPVPTHLNKNTELKIELYTNDRYVMFGGNHPQGDWNFDATSAFHETIAEYFAKPAETGKPGGVTPQPAALDISDEQVLTRAMAKPSASNAFGTGASFNDLYTANAEVLAKSHPAIGHGEAYDASGADLALANMLACQTRNKDQIIRIMGTSKLVRPKWSEHRTYLSVTVDKALADRNITHLPTAQSNSSVDESQVLSDMPQEFDGCYFVTSENAIFTPQYELCKKEVFDMCFAAPHQQVKPYKTFESNAAVSGRIVKYLGFRPDQKYCEITEREGDRYINTYQPLKIRAIQGDMAPFFRFFNANYPNERDQRIILSYFATLAQKPGIKAQWCVVLQGTQGCGKSLLANLVAYACGEKYTHRAKGDEFENRFTSQWFGKTLMLAEDVQLKGDKLQDVLKALLTQSLYPIEGKGTRIRMLDLPINLIITLNNFDVLQKTKDARRFAVFMSAFQNPEDLTNAGLVDSEWAKIVHWSNNGGKEAFAYFILNYKADPQFDFSLGCNTAPHTSTTEDAIIASRDNIIDLLLEVIESGHVGFRGNFISSTYLSNLISLPGHKGLISFAQRSKILKELDYIPHPGLYKGRAKRNVLPDNKRPTIYVTKDHPTLKMTDDEAILKAYEDANK